MLRATKEWGVLPSAVGLCVPAEDLTWMVAYVRAEAAMQGVEAQEMERERKKPRKRKQ